MQISYKKKVGTQSRLWLHLPSSCHLLTTRTVQSAWQFKLFSLVPSEGHRAWYAWGSPLAKGLPLHGVAGASLQDVLRHLVLQVEGIQGWSGHWGEGVRGCRGEGTSLILVAMWLFSLLCPEQSQQDELVFLAEDVAIIFLYSGLHGGLDYSLLFLVTLRWGSDCSLFASCFVCSTALWYMYVHPLF